MEDATRVYFLLHSRLLKEAIIRPLRSARGIHLLGTGYDLEQALAELAELDADVVLIDASSDHQASLHWTAQIRDSFPGLRILPLGLASEDHVLAFLEMGANGYLLATAGFPEVLRTIQAVRQDAPPCSPRIVASVRARLVDLSAHRRQQNADGELVLTGREREVLALLSSGQRNKEIAHALGISLPTVKNHVHKILDKLQVRSRRQAIRRALETGLLRVDEIRRPVARQR